MNALWAKRTCQSITRKWMLCYIPSPLRSLASGQWRPLFSSSSPFSFSSSFLFPKAADRFLACAKPLLKIFIYYIIFFFTLPFQSVTFVRSPCGRTLRLLFFCRSQSWRNFARSAFVFLSIGDYYRPQCSFLLRQREKGNISASSPDMSISRSHNAGPCNRGRCGRAGGGRQFWAGE